MQICKCLISGNLQDEDQVFEDYWMPKIAVLAITSGNLCRDEGFSNSFYIRMKFSLSPFLHF